MSEPAAKIANALTAWFDASARDLPWRATRDPYAIWVSEVMLQQTRVETVERYYDAFMARFPSLAVLARAEQDEVLEQWSGLGYYRRARMLHAGARHVAQHHGGRVPRDARALRAIPGVGPYTLGAISSIAFDEPVPLVDGNIARVLSRLYAIADPKRQVATDRDHPPRVEAILSAGRPRVLAQALMELGATLCKPRNPECERCPIADHCVAYAEGKSDEIPAAKSRKVPRVERHHAIAVWWGSRLLLEKRPATGLLASLWCLPLLESGDDPAEPSALRVESFLGFAVKPLASRDLPGVRHVFSHRVWQLHIAEYRVLRRPSLRGRTPVRSWYALDDDVDGGVPTATRKLLDAIASPRARD